MHDGVAYAIAMHDGVAYAIAMHDGVHCSLSILLKKSNCYLLFRPVTQGTTALCRCNSRDTSCRGAIPCTQYWTLAGTGLCSLIDLSERSSGDTSLHHSSRYGVSASVYHAHTRCPVTSLAKQCCGRVYCIGNVCECNYCEYTSHVGINTD